MRIRILAPVVLGAAALAAGCGGGGGDGEDRLTKEEYIQQADAICAETDEKIDALGEPQTLEEFAAMGAEALSISEEQLDALRALRPPVEIEAQVNEAYDLLEQQNEIVSQMVAAAEEGDEATVTDLVAQGEPLDAQADEIANEIGLTECGSDA